MAQEAEYGISWNPIAVCTFFLWHPPLSVSISAPCVRAWLKSYWFQDCYWVHLCISHSASVSVLYKKLTHQVLVDVPGCFTASKTRSQHSWPLSLLVFSSDHTSFQIPRFLLIRCAALVSPAVSISRSARTGQPLLDGSALSSPAYQEQLLGLDLGSAIMSCVTLTPTI